MNSCRVLLSPQVPFVAVPSANADANEAQYQEYHTYDESSVRVTILVLFRRNCGI